MKRHKQTKAAKADAKRKSKRPAKTKRGAPRTAEQFSKRPEKFKNMWTRLVDALSKMRSEKASLERASRESGISPRTIKRWAGSALQKSGGGKWSPKKDDNLLRVLIVPTEKGKREIGVRGFRQASLLGEYWSATQRFFATGDASGLKKFRGKKIRDASGEQISLITDLAVLNRLGSAGVLSFESLYARSM